MGTGSGKSWVTWTGLDVGQWRGVDLGGRSGAGGEGMEGKHLEAEV